MQFLASGVNCKVNRALHGGHISPSHTNCGQPFKGPKARGQDLAIDFFLAVL